MLTAFTASLLLITVSELGDKTFCIAMLLAMRNSRRLVFMGVAAALVTMTLISVLMGQVVALLPKTYLHIAEVVLFIAFGLKLLADAYRMPAISHCGEVTEAEKEIALATQKSSSINNKNPLGIVLQAFTLTFIGEWGDRTQFATIALAASNNVLAVIAGSILGHLICAAIAVLSGRMIANWLSERVLTAIGGGLFMVFGIVAAIETV
jgi:Ca2+/H+ antiporter, TMEM165/GDT1 family